MNSKVYKTCAVPQCGSTSTKTPDKLFVFVPLKKTVRNKWLKLARRKFTKISPNTQLYFCEDHFDMPNDMENYMQYHLMGSVSQVRMKPGCLPKRFRCQPDRRKRTSDASDVTERSYILKKQRRTLIEECEKDLKDSTVATAQEERYKRHKRFMEHREKRKFKEKSKKSRKMSATTTTTTESTSMEVVEIKKQDPEPEIDQRIKTEMFPNSNFNTEITDIEIVEFKEEPQDIDEAIEIQSLLDSNVNIETEFVEIKKEVPTMDQWVQVEFFSKSNQNTRTFICNRYLYDDICDVEIQTEINICTSSLLTPYKNKLVNKGCGPFRLVSIDHETQTENINFHGFESITENGQLAEFAGINFENFAFLLNRMGTKESEKFEKNKIAQKDRLLIFLMKIKLGFTFDALGVLFSVHRTTISRIFFETLVSLVKVTKNLVFWPDVNVVQKTMPKYFHPKYSDTKVIIDCLEFKIEVPLNIGNRASTYSNSKKSLTAKVLVGITPGGLICFKSKVAGGAKSDSQMTIESGLLNLLKDGDIILANNEFPEIKKVIDRSGKKIRVIVPPLLEKINELSNGETQETCNVSKVRAHVDRMLERLRSYQILSKISDNLFHSLDDIMHICCVLVSLQTSVFLNRKDKKT